MDTDSSICLWSTWSYCSKQQGIRYEGLRQSILFYLKEDGLVNISIFHADGKFLKTFNKEGIAGENFEAWIGENLPTGNYFVRLFQKGKTAFYKGTLH